MTRVVALMGFGYDGKQLAKGEVFALTGQMHDERLLRLNYVREFTGQGWACGACGAEFATEMILSQHISIRHKEDDIDDTERDN